MSQIAFTRLDGDRGHSSSVSGYRRALASGTFGNTGGTSAWQSRWMESERRGPGSVAAERAVVVL